MPTSSPDGRLVRVDGKPTITPYVIAYNEAEKIEAAISSVLWADEVILADIHSTDGTDEFVKYYVFKLGILDGWPDFVISFGAGEGAFCKHAKAFASKLDDRPPDSPPLHCEDESASGFRAPGTHD